MASITVIVPIFNKAPYLPDTIKSICSQTCKDFEILMINDESTDDSEAVARRLIAENSSISMRLLSKKNGGISDTRNFGISHANTPFIACIDGDDQMQPTFLEKALSALQAGDVSLVTSNVELFGEQDGEWIPNSYEPYSQRYNNDIPTLVVYRKELWEKVGGYKRAFPFNEDWDFFVAIEQAGVKVHKIDEKLFRYRVSGGGLAIQFMKDTWQYGFATIASSNEQLYSVGRTLSAHQILLSMPERWVPRYEKQDLLFPNEWLLKYWLAIAARRNGQTEKAKDLYHRAMELSGFANWQPIFFYAEMLALEDRKIEAAQHYHHCRLIRPDTELYIEERIKAL